ncbi:MAG: HEAT repeat domain-containing protein [Kiritimatiellae bacterium]|nr:HEAT repeat domain-containing protein [Kiritimatiellia bacterium]
MANTRIVVATAAILTAGAFMASGEPLRVGLFKDSRSGELEGIRKTLEAEGFAVDVIGEDTLRDPAALAPLKVIFLPGGWSRGGIQFGGFAGRRNLVDFVARGKGILAGGFRSGWFRTTNRPLFPQVGYTYLKGNGKFLFPKGESDLVKGFDQPYPVDEADQVWVRPGALGKVFAVNSGGTPIGVHGDVFGGRYAILGCFIASGGWKLNPQGFVKKAMEDAAARAKARGEPPPAAAPVEEKIAPEMEGMERVVFMNCVRWLAGAPAPSAADLEHNRSAAELDFLRREAHLDWLLDEKGPDTDIGVLPQIRNDLDTPLLSRLWQLEFAAANLEVKDKARAGEAIKRLQATLDKLQANYTLEAQKKKREINGMDLAGLVADNPVLGKEAVLAKIARATGSDEAEKKKLSQAVSAKGVSYDQIQRRILKFIYGDQMRRALCSGLEPEAELAAADKIITELDPLAAAARSAADKREIGQDLNAVPNLIKQCGGEDVKTRSFAVYELGRLGDRRAVPALLERLADGDLEVRIRAIQSLAWMQASEAVPALLGMLASDEPRLRRRAAQALGQIGDARAIQPLLKAMDDPDHHTRQNAVLALGWLGAKDAVPALVKMASAGDRMDPYRRDLMICAIRALGHIGDQRSEPILEKWAREAKDAPTMRYGDGQPRRTNIYACAVSLGLQGYSELALAEIKQGGRRQAGIVQPDYLRLRNNFHGLQDNYNFLAGRPLDYVAGYFNGDLDGLFAGIRHCGGTGLNCGSALSRGEYQPDAYKAILRKAGTYGLRWIDSMPSNYGGTSPGEPDYRNHVNGNILGKPGAELVLMAYADVPAFQGFWAEETWPDISPDDPEVQKGFVGFLVKKHGADFRAKLGLAADAPVRPPPEDQKADNPRLWADFVEYAGHVLIAEWREGQEWLRGLRKGAAFTWSESEAIYYKYIGLYGVMGGAIDGFGPQRYLNGFPPESVLWMELAKDGEPRAVMCEDYSIMDPSPRHTRLGLSSELVHGECFFNWGLEQIFQKNKGGWGFDKTKWNIVTDVFTRARRLSDYLGGVSSAANVALVASERTQRLLYADKLGDYMGPILKFPWRYNEQLLAGWVLLRQAGAPADAIWAETMTPGKLARYKVLLLPDARSLTSGQADILQSWVQAGGVLIATGATSLFDEAGQPLKDYALADVFGVSYQGHGAEASPEATDTLCFAPKQPPLKVQAEGLDATLFRRYAYREMKPAISVGACKVTQVGAELPGLAGDAAMEYDLPLGYDKVAPKTATILAKMPSGDPALTVNRFGQGLCYFVAPIYPALGYTQGETVYTPQVFNFWPGVVEMFSAMIRGGLQARGVFMPAEVVAGPRADIEVTVRKHPRKDLWIIHLLDWNTNTGKTSGVRLAVRPPEGRKTVKVFYPDGGQPVEFTATAGGIEFPVRDFDVHEMMVVEY